MKGFPGFPDGRQKLTPVPNLFFTELLPYIDDLDELKVTLYTFWALYQKEERFQYLQRSEMANDRLLMEGLSTSTKSGPEALDEALERAVARGTLFQIDLETGEGEERYYFLNTPRGRAAVRAVERGDWRPTGMSEQPIELATSRPNIFTLYEQNIGPLTPMIAEELRAAEEEYPLSWIEEAIRIAVENNVRKWRYVEAILEDWKTRGRDEREHRGDTEKARRRYVEGEYADLFGED